MAKKNRAIIKVDQAHVEADSEIVKMSREVKAVYQRASDEMQAKLDKYLQNFNTAVEKKQKELSDGTITEQEYKEWYRTKLANKALRTKTWAGLRDNLAKDVSNSNDIARSIIYGHLPDVYANNFNFGTYEVEKGTGIDTSFTLYDRDTVERLMKKGQQLLPPPPDTEKWRNSGIKVAKNTTAKKKDIQWNSRAIQAELTQGILQGESIPNLSKRIRHVQLMNNHASIRYARTMTTGAENAGRIDSYERARKIGIDVRPEWMATLDERTRDSHRALDGEIRDEKTGKFSNGCRFPGDPEGRPEEVYNCRCTMVAHIAGIDDDEDLTDRPSELLKTMSYDEWKAGHKKKAEETVEHSDKFSEIKKVLDVNHVTFYEPTKTNKKGYGKNGKVNWDVVDESYKELAGGDLTKGSCASLSIAFAGRMAGYDVHDYRDGNSRSIFSLNSTLNSLWNMKGIKYFEEEENSDIKSAEKVLQNCEDGKLYILRTGRHAAVVTSDTKDGKKQYQYLEMQSSIQNGFKKIDNLTATLRNRFGCKQSHRIYGQRYQLPSQLVDIESLTNSDDFKDLLGYINTPIDKQKKGSSGYER